MKRFISNRFRRRLLVASSLFAVAIGGQHVLAKHVDNGSDNNGRQIAAVIPGMPRPITISVPNLPSGQTKMTPIVQTHGRKTTITVPKSVEEVVDAAWVASNKFAKASYQKVTEVWKWLVAWYKQNHSAPVITPAGSPYVQGPVTHSQQLYYTHEGRLKTVVKR